MRRRCERYEPAGGRSGAGLPPGWEGHRDSTSARMDTRRRRGAPAICAVVLPVDDIALPWAFVATFAKDEDVAGGPVRRPFGAPACPEVAAAGGRGSPTRRTSRARTP